MKSLKHVLFSLVLALLVTLIPSKAYAADNIIGNEIINTANGTLTRTGAGTVANPFKLQLNLSNENTWDGNQTFTGLTQFGSGGTNTIISPTGEIFANGAIHANGDVEVNNGNLTSTNWQANIFNTNVGNLNIGGQANFISLGGSWSNTFVNGSLFVQQNLTAFNAVTFSPNWIEDVTVNTDSDSTLILNGLNTSSGEALCIDGSNNVVKCAGAFSAASGQENTNLEETVKAQQSEIDQLKKEVAELKAALAN
jgi:hypothetical protein